MTTDFARTTQLLVVDDDVTLVRLLTRTINRSFGDSILIKSLSDPVEARKTIEQRNVDILITDLEMPGVNGLELLKCAKRRHACAQVIFVTGHSSLSALTDALEMGATDYLLKPLDQALLVKLVADAQDRIVRWREAVAGTLLTVAG